MLCWNLKAVLEEQGINSRELARRSGVRYKIIVELCENPNRRTRITTIDRLARALGVTRADLLTTSQTY